METTRAARFGMSRAERFRTLLAEAGVPRAAMPPLCTSLDMHLPNVARIAVLRANGIGDLMFALPALDALRAAYPDREQFATGDPARFFPYSPVVGPLNAIAPPVVFTFDGERMSGHGYLPAPYTGPPGTVHGGVVAMVLDELLGAVPRDLVPDAYTGTLTVRYERPTPIDAGLAFDAWVDRTEGRKVFTVGTISAGGTVTARAEGVFIRVEQPIPAD